jgi:hypothetical protein
MKKNFLNKILQNSIFKLGSILKLCVKTYVLSKWSKTIPWSFCIYIVRQMFIKFMSRIFTTNNNNNDNSLILKNDIYIGHNHKSTNHE